MEIAFIAGIGFLFVLAIGLFAVLLPVMAIVDIVRSTFQNSNDKLIWIIVVLCFNIIGSILYFTIGVNQKLRY